MSNRIMLARGMNLLTKRGGKIVRKTFHCKTKRVCPDCELELSKDGKKLANGGRHSKDEFNNCVTPD